MNTKVYIVVSYHFSSMCVNSPAAIFTNKIQAEFWIYKKNQEKQDIFYYKTYSVIEVPLLTIELQGKEFYKFRSEHIKKLEKKIKEQEKCSSEDLTEIKEAQEEISILNKI